MTRTEVVTCDFCGKEHTRNLRPFGNLIVGGPNFGFMSTYVFSWDICSACFEKSGLTPTTGPPTRESGEDGEQK